MMALSQATVLALLLSRAAFEVASLKPAQPTPPYPVVPGNLIHGTLTLGNVTLAECLKFALNLKSDSLVAGPEWIRSHDVLFNITAKAAPDTSVSETRLMALHLLVDRFDLKLHLEQRQLPTYAMVVDKGGAKLTTA